MAKEQEVKVGGSYEQPTAGSAGVQTQVAGQATTVSAVAGATGGIGAGNLITPSIDEKLFKFKSDDTPLMQIMLHAKRVNVKSPIVQHYIIDEPKSFVTTKDAVTKGTDNQFILPLLSQDQKLPRGYTTLLCKGVSGYDATGQKETPNKELMLFVVGRDTTSGNPVAIAVNGPRAVSTDEYCTTPAIPAGTVCVLMANACYETQKEVDPDLVVPQPVTLHLQRRVMNSITSDYFNSQEKQIPFDKALIAEAQITNFKVKGNRTLYAGEKGQITVDTPKMGPQTIYFSEGVRYQVKKEIKDDGKWTFKKFIALAKLIFTGEDVPKSITGLCGKNFLEKIQTIDFSEHPEIKIEVKTNPLGWDVTNIHTVFGDLEFKHDPTLDRLRWSNSCLMIAYDRCVHYVYSNEHKTTDRVEGEEATREATIVWDGLGLKGTCHVWIDGEGTAESDNDVVHMHLWNSAEAPASPKANCVYYLMTDCPGIGANAKSGTVWIYKDTAWAPYTGELPTA